SLSGRRRTGEPADRPMGRTASESRAVDGGSTVSALVDFDEAITRYAPVMGLEGHVELNTATKMFCGCETGLGAEPNTQTCPVCVGRAGSLRVVTANTVLSAL